MKMKSNRIINRKIKNHAMVKRRKIKSTVLASTSPGTARIADTEFSSWDTPFITHHIFEDFSLSELKDTIYSDNTVNFNQIRTGKISAVPLINYVLKQMDPKEREHKKDYPAWGGALFTFRQASIL